MSIDRDDFASNINADLKRAVEADNRLHSIISKIDFLLSTENYSSASEYIYYSARILTELNADLEALSCLVDSIIDD